MGPPPVLPPLEYWHVKESGDQFFLLWSIGTSSEAHRRHPRLVQVDVPGLPKLSHSLRSYIILIGDALGAGPAPAASFCSSTPRPCLQPRGFDHFSQTRRAMLNARVCHATSSTRHTLPPKKVINWTMACSHWRRCGGTFSHVIILNYAQPLRPLL